MSNQLMTPTHCRKKCDDKDSTMLPRHKYNLQLETTCKTVREHICITTINLMHSVNSPKGCTPRKYPLDFYTLSKWRNLWDNYTLNTGLITIGEIASSKRELNPNGCQNG